MKMKRATMLNALRAVSPGLASSENIEQSTSFVFKDGMVITYNDEIAASYPLDMGKITGAVSSKELLAVINKMSSKEVEVKMGEGELLLSGGRVNAGIVLEEEINLPILSFSPEQGYYVLPGAFLEGLKVCLFSASSEAVSPVLSNIHMKESFVESCDNNRLTRFDLGEDSQDDCLIPATAASHLVKTNVDEYGEEAGWMFFQESQTGLVIAARVHDDTYPDTGPFLNITDYSDVTLPDELAQIIERTEIFSVDGDRGHDLVDVDIRNGTILVKSQNDRGWIEEDCSAETGEADLYFSVNPDLLRDILKITHQAKLTERTILFEAEKMQHVVTLMSPPEE